MNDEGDLLLLLLLGPAGAIGLYWAMYRYYRNTDKSHAFENETSVTTESVIGSDDKVSEVRGTKNKRIDGDNVREYRKRVKRVR
jgi:hypothetical protein